jgi:hypothetical protein
MPEYLQVYVDGIGVHIPHESLAIDAVRAADPDAADRVERGELVITDSRGLPTPPDTPSYGGSIYRLVPYRAPRDG